MELKGIQFRAVTAFNRLREDVGRLGTAADTVELRRRVADGTTRFKALAAEFKERAASHPARDSSAAQKLLRDFQSLLRSSERLMQTAKAKEASSLPRAERGSGSSAAAAARQQQGEAEQAEQERAALLEAQRKQELLSMENALQFNEAIIEERDAAITEISGQIGEVGVPVCRQRWPTPVAISRNWGFVDLNVALAVWCWPCRSHSVRISPRCYRNLCSFSIVGSK